MTHVDILTKMNIYTFMNIYDNDSVSLHTTLLCSFGHSNCLLEASVKTLLCNGVVPLSNKKGKCSLVPCTLIY